MLAKSDYAAIAARASNLDERVGTVKSLESTLGPIPLAELELETNIKWRHEKFQSKIALMQLQESTFKGENNFIPDANELNTYLTKFSVITSNLSGLQDYAYDFLCDLHKGWLGIYAEAMGLASSTPYSLDPEWWSQESVYYDAGGIVIKPFLLIIKRRVLKACARLSEANTINVNSEEICRSIQMHYINRFRIMIARALEAEIKAERILESQSESQSRNNFRHYLDKIFNTDKGCHEFFLNFPVMARWLSIYARNICNHVGSLLDDLGTDKSDISKELLQDSTISRVATIEIGKSDPHNKTRSVAILQVETILNNGEQRNVSIVYKPRCVGLEKGLQVLLETVSRHTTVHYNTYKVLNKNDHGWCSFLLAEGNEASEHESIEKFFCQLGGYLAIGYAFGASDLHYENIIASDLNAFICDAETIVEIIPEGMTEVSSLFNSVFRTGLLEWPRYVEDDDRLDISGISGGESYKSPITVPVVENPGLLSMRVVAQEDSFINSVADNKITLNGEFVSPSKHRDSVINGFDAVFNWLSTCGAEAYDVVKHNFYKKYARFVNRSTQIYATLISAAEHAKCLCDPLEVDLVFFSLIRHPCNWDPSGVLSTLEFKALWGLDVPLFSAQVDNVWLFYEGKQINKRLSISAAENIRNRLSDLTESARIQQNRYILASLSRSSDDNAEFNSCCLDYACKVADSICQSITNDVLAPWSTVEYWAGGKQVVPVDGSLYNGSCGISLYMAYMNEICPRKPYKDAALLGLEHSRKNFCTERVGVFQGGFGLVYLLTHLGVLWNNVDLLSEAKRYSIQLSDSIQSDCIFDIIQGAAGAIPALLALSRLTQDADCLDIACQCGIHLVNHAEMSSHGVSWRAPDSRGTANLTGFSHGAAGIGWALIMLGHELGDSSFIEIGLKAFAYEQSKFDQKSRNWLDLRQSVASKSSSQARTSWYWCSGSTGIGLSRISAWNMLGDRYHAGLQQASIALEATLGSFARLDNDCLCHGKAGNAEFLLRYGLITANSRLIMEARIQAMEMWASFERRKTWSSGLSVGDFMPGIMLGLSGIGMHFLRLAYPEFVPSPLLLDCPHSVKSR